MFKILEIYGKDYKQLVTGCSYIFKAEQMTGQYIHEVITTASTATNISYLLLKN